MNDTLKTASVTVAAALLTASITGLSTWAYTMHDLILSHDAKLFLLIDSNGDIKPSTKVAVLEERIRNLCGR